MSNLIAMGNCKNGAYCEKNGLRDEIDILKDRLGETCLLVAKMHEAATGYIGAPAIGVIEDVAKLRADHIAMSAIAHRLAIELECLVMDTKDLSIQSKWWETSMAALSDWHEMLDKEQPHVSAFGKD